MEPVVPKFIDELIDFSLEDKKRNQSSASEIAVTPKPKLELGQEDPQYSPEQPKSLRRH